MDHVSKAIREALKETSSPTTLTPQMNRAAPRDPEAALAEATRLAEKALAEIKRRWPNQTAWTQDKEYERAWGRAIAEQAQPITWPDLARALGKVTDRPYPPNIGALLEWCKPEQLISMEDAQKALVQIDRAHAKGTWWELPSFIWQAVRELPGGSSAIRNRAAYGPTADKFLETWQATITRAIEHPNADLLAEQPLRPVPTLGPSDDELARRASVAEEHLKEISKLLGIRMANAC